MLKRKIKKRWTRKEEKEQYEKVEKNSLPKNKNKPAQWKPVRTFYKVRETSVKEVSYGQRFNSHSVEKGVRGTDNKVFNTLSARIGLVILFTEIGHSKRQMSLAQHLFAEKPATLC